MKKKILVADDNILTRELFVEQLSILGYEAVEADNGQTALVVFENSCFDMILTDCDMPVMDGYELARTIRLRAGSTSMSIPILAVTGTVDDAGRLNCLAAGMDDCLVKPVTLEQLQDIVQHWLDKSS